MQMAMAGALATLLAFGSMAPTPGTPPADAAATEPAGTPRADPRPPVVPLIETEAAIGDLSYLQYFSLDPARRMSVDVSINQQGPFSFVVDTGSERTIISRELAGRLDLVRGQRLVLSTLSGRSETTSYRIAALATANVRMAGVEAPALAARDMGAAGLLGIDSLQERRVIFDFRRRHMDLRESRVRERPTVRDDDTIVVMARSRTGRLILSDAYIGGRRISLIVDTGAATSIGNPALRDLAVKRRMVAGQLRPLSLTSVTGDEVMAQAGTLKHIELGRGTTINDLPISFADAHAFHTLGFGDRPAMLLGMDALQLFDRVEIDFANRRVVFDLPDGAGRSGGLRLASAR